MKCAIVECDGTAHAKGLCVKHYARLKKTGSTDDPRKELKERGRKFDHPLWKRWLVLLRREVLCDEWKDFWCFVDAVGDPGDSNKLQRMDTGKPFGPGNFRWSKPLTPERASEYGKQWYRANAERQRHYRAKRQYGIEPEHLASMVERQNNRCAICGCEETRFKDDEHKTKWSLAVDHDHGTGRVRGLLCGDCNVGLGAFKDDTDRLLSAILYLKSHRDGGSS